MDRTEIKTVIEKKWFASPAGRPFLVGISGIDASGKGYVAGKFAAEFESAGYRVALINVDGWLNLPEVRFLSQQKTPLADRRGAHASSAGSAGRTPEGSHFYHHALRLDEMFERLILPLKETCEVNISMDFAEETATEFHPHTYLFANIDIILLEGIFIFKRAFVRHFDLRIWIECSFETALERAVARGQENLSPAATMSAYERIYFPAQRVHFETDDPISSADVLCSNG